LAKNFVVTLVLLWAPVSVYGADCDTLPGEWSWFTGGVVTFTNNHAILYDGKAAGKWECTDNARATAKLHWSNGFIDSIAVSGDHISGTNQQGVAISATRKQIASRPEAAPVVPSAPAKTPESAGPSQRATLSTHTQAADPRLAQGWCVTDRNNYQQAITFLNSVLARNSQDAEALYYRGRCWYYAKQYQRALQDLNASLTLDARNSWAYLYRGRIFGRTGANNYKVAAEFTRAIEMDSSNGDAYFARAVLYVQVFPSEGLDAYKDLTRTIALKPQFPEAHVVRAEVLLDYNQPQSALADLNQAKALDPNYPDLDCRYGLAYWIAGQRQLGDQWLNRCYTRDPEARPVYENEKQIRLQAAARNSQRTAASGCHQGNWREECTQELKHDPIAGPFPSQGAIANCVQQKWAACNYTVP
jgi:tetratricopeptide (TPR) repeat protein